MRNVLDPIESPANPRVRDWAKLRSGRRRRQAGRFLIDGGYELDQAITGKIFIEEVLLSSSLEEGPLSEWQEKLNENQVEWRRVSEAVLEKVSVRENPDGIIAVARTPDRAFSIPVDPGGPLIVANRIEKPGNLGALIRTCYAVGAAGVVLCDPAVDFESPQVIRASRGLVFRLPGWTSTASELINLLGQSTLTVFAADKNSEQIFWEANWPSDPVIVLGEEHFGLSNEWDHEWITGLRIPMEKGIDSLNVSVSGALLLYEWKRQQRAERT
ncbi:MAG: RNA methyltransferase [Verrucomicrobiota bacterium]